MKPEGRPGSGRREASAADRAELLLDLLRDLGEVALELLLLVADLAEGVALLGPGRGELGGALLELGAGLLELLLAAGDLVAGRLHRLDRLLASRRAARAPGRRSRSPGPRGAACTRCARAGRRSRRSRGRRSAGRARRTCRSRPAGPRGSSIARCSRSRRILQPGLGLVAARPASGRARRRPPPPCCEGRRPGPRARDLLGGRGDLGGQHALLLLDVGELVLGLGEPLLEASGRAPARRGRAGADREHGTARALSRRSGAAEASRES